MSGPVATDDVDAGARGPDPADGPGRRDRPGARRPRSARCPCAGSCRNGRAAPSGPGASSITSAPSRCRAGRGVRHRAPSPHGPPDRDLARGGRAAASRQPGLRAADPARPAEPHDGRPRGGPRRGGPGAAPRRSTPSSSGWRSPRPPATVRPPSSITPSCRGSSSTAPRRPSSSATSAGADSPARRDTEHMGVELTLRGAGHGAAAPHATTSTRWSSWRAGSRWTAWRWSRACWPISGWAGTSAGSRSTAPARALLLGGVPVPRDPSSCGGTSWAAAARRSPRPGGSGRRDDGRFGHVRSSLGADRGGPPPWE